ncbi:F204A protein, partial [Acrocephalus arundinaceus]|nr:F204A protein [Acrocephalus arundinaceus]
MWSGLLPPGLNESDVDLSSDDGDESPDSCSKQDATEDTERVQGTGQESNTSSEPVVPVTDEEGESQTCPPGVSVNIWNKFLELQKKHREMKMQIKEENRCRKRKRRRKGGFFMINRICFFQFELLENEDKWKELTQYFGINDRFESPVDSRAPQKSGLELSIEKCVAEGDIAKAEELSDRLATREVSGLLTKTL